MTTYLSEENKTPLPTPQLVEASFVANNNKSLALYTDPALYEACKTRIAFTTRHGGVSEEPYRSLNLGTHVDDAPEAVQENRQHLLDAVGAGSYTDQLIVPNQIHSDRVLVVDTVQETRACAQQGADGIVCTQNEVPVLLCFADCVPVICVAPQGAFAVLHAGWRGALAGICSKGLEALCAQAQCTPGDCNIYIGPHIGPECFEVGPEVYDSFIETFGHLCDAGYRHLDLSAAIIADVERIGADSSRIVDIQKCTVCCNDDFFSYRAENGMTGRHGALALKEECS